MDRRQRHIRQNLINPFQNPNQRRRAEGHLTRSHLIGREGNPDALARRRQEARFLTGLREEAARINQGMGTDWNNQPTRTQDQYAQLGQALTNWHPETQVSLDYTNLRTGQLETRQMLTGFAPTNDQNQLARRGMLVETMNEMVDIMTQRASNDINSLRLSILVHVPNTTFNQLLDKASLSVQGNSDEANMIRIVCDTVLIYRNFNMDPQRRQNFLTQFYPQTRLVPTYDAKSCLLTLHEVLNNRQAGDPHIDQLKDYLNRELLKV